MANTKQTVSIQIPVAWGEQDGFGHVNNVVFFRYFENVRMYFLERTGLLGTFSEKGHGVILASTTCDFKLPVKWPDLLTIHTWCTAVGNTSFTLAYEVFNNAGGTVATGTSVQVMYDYNNATKMTIPDQVRKAISEVS